MNNDITRPDFVATVDPGAGEVLSIAGGAYRILLSGAQTLGACAIIEMTVPPNAGPGPHAHKDIQESFYVLEGEVVFRSETQTYVARKGAYVNIPFGGAIHNFKNESAEIAKLLCMVTPAGMEEMFREMAQQNTSGSSAPGTPDWLTKMKALSAKYGMEVFPPDHFKKIEG